MVALLTWMLLRTHALEAEGLFRVSPESSTLDELRRFMVTENWTEIQAQTNPHVFAAMLKVPFRRVVMVAAKFLTSKRQNYFATLTVPLFPDATRVLALWRNGVCEWADVLALLSSLPLAVLSLVWWWVSLCRLISAYDHATAMVSGERVNVVVWSVCVAYWLMWR